MTGDGSAPGPPEPATYRLGAVLVAVSGVGLAALLEPVLRAGRGVVLGTVQGVVLGGVLGAVRGAALSLMKLCEEIVFST